ncbi:hypothetical protein G4B88_015919 [Cannabis sativa]|uniref:RNase H type-1 domain-containing protein n=1 Tax=Cannabis sativa TaxID=3483 RepID=A0A7J6ESA3_CANSA|nr:hypothetical protein G4B88_015919 [Cannabis sativa]
MDSWLPGHTDFTPFSFIGADSSLQADIDRILSIPLSIFPTEDVLIWNGNNSGNYTVNIWFERNAEFHGKSPKQLAAILVFATDYLAKYQTVHATPMSSNSIVVPNITSATATPNASPAAPWIAPPVGKLKLNIDASYNKANGLIDFSGYIRAAFLKSIKGCFKPKEMEATALALTLKWLISHGLSDDLIETDSLLVMLRLGYRCYSSIVVLLSV